MPQARFWVAFKMPSKGPGLSSPPASDEPPPGQWRPCEALGFSSPPAVMRCPASEIRGGQTENLDIHLLSRNEEAILPIKSMTPLQELERPPSPAVWSPFWRVGDSE